MVLPVSNYKNFIPALWSARLLANLDKSLVFLGMVSRDYEGEISGYGDTVKINSVGSISIKDYTGADIDDPEELSSTQQDLKIDQAKYFNFAVKDVDKAQANVSLVDKAMERAGYSMADVIDQDIASLVTDTQIAGVGTVAAPIEIDAANAYDSLVDLSVKLDEKNVPKAGRKIVLPPWFFGMLAKDVRFVNNFNVLPNGVVENAVVSGFSLLMSNNVKTGTGGTYQVMAGTDQGIAFANQVVETEAYRPEKNFSDAVKGLSVWGRNVVQPDVLARFVIKPKPAA